MPADAATREGGKLAKIGLKKRALANPRERDAGRHESGTSRGENYFESMVHRSTGLISSDFETSDRRKQFIRLSRAIAVERADWFTASVELICPELIAKMLGSASALSSRRRSVAVSDFSNAIARARSCDMGRDS